MNLGRTIFFDDRVYDSAPIVRRMNKPTTQPNNESVSSQADSVPLVAVEGSAFDCGREYARIVLSRYPGYHRYLIMLEAWRRLPRHVEKLFDQSAPHIPEVYRGMLAAFSPSTCQNAPQPSPAPGRKNGSTPGEKNDLEEAEKNAGLFTGFCRW